MFRVELTEQVHGREQGRIPRGPERKSVDELGGELAEVGVAALEEVEVVVVEGPDDPVGLVDGVLGVRPEGCGGRWPVAGPHP